MRIILYSGKKPPARNFATTPPLKSNFCSIPALKCIQYGVRLVDFWRFKNPVSKLQKHSNSGWNGYKHPFSKSWTWRFQGVLCVKIPGIPYPRARRSRVNSFERPYAWLRVLFTHHVRWGMWEGNLRRKGTARWRRCKLKDINPFGPSNMPDISLSSSIIIHLSLFFTKQNTDPKDLKYTNALVGIFILTWMTLISEWR